MIRAEAIAVVETRAESLPSLVDRAARALASARTSAEVLEARDTASLAYDIAKKAARLAQAKGAHDTLVAAAHRAQADALLIESQAKRRLADEYDAAQARGEVQAHGRVDILDGNIKPTISDIGLTAKAVFEARQIRDAEERDPGIISRTLEASLERGEEPTRAEVKRAIGPTTYLNERAAEEEREISTKRDFRNLRKLWNASTADAKQQFRDYIAKS